MNCRGVVEVIVALIGVQIGVLTPATYTIVVFVAIVTSVMAPPVLRLAMRRVETTTEETARRMAYSGNSASTSLADLA
jgi:Kef-type K+ transport system membrane component KefB